MDDWHYFFEHVPHNVESGTYRIFEPEWKAGILHWFSREDVAKEQKEDFIRALVAFDDDCGGFYRYRAYFLASEALAHFKDCSLGDAIVGQLLRWSYVYFNQVKAEWQKVPDLLAQAARAGLAVTDIERVKTAFLHLLHTTESQFTLRHAAERLGKLDPGNPTAIAALVLLIQKTENESTLKSAISSLVNIGYGSPIAVATLVNFMQTRQNEYERGLVARDLGKIGYGNEMAIAALVELTQKAPCGNPSAIEALGEIGYGNEMAIAALKQMQTHREEYIRCLASTAILKLDPGNLTAIAILHQILETTEQVFTRWEAAAALAQTNNYQHKVLYTLGELELVLRVCDDVYDLPGVASRLERIDPSHQLAINALVQLIRNTKDKVAFGIAVSELGLIAANSEVAITTLVQLLAATQDEYILVRAATSLGLIDPGNQIAIATLIRLTDSESIHTPEDAARRLAKISAGDESAIATLTQFIQTFDANKYEGYLERIANSFREIPPGNQLPQLVSALKANLSPEVKKNYYSRYEACSRIIWYCAQKMSYPDFYRVWHN